MYTELERHMRQYVLHKIFDLLNDYGNSFMEHCRPEERDAAKANAAIEALRDACANDKNVMPYLVDAAHAYVTLSEMTDVMREVFGLYLEPLHI